MKKSIRLTERELTNLVRRIIQESKSKKTHSKKEILGMSKDELKDVYGDLEVKGEYLGKKGTFHHFKKTSLGDVVCSFRTDDSTPSGLKRNTQAVKVKSDDVKFKKHINESKEDRGTSCEDLMSSMRYIYQDFQSYVSTNADDFDANEVYNDLESELGGIIDKAEEMDCDNFYDLLEMYEEYTETFAEMLELR